MTSITTALIPVAGLGTRFQPFSHAAGKEFLPVFTADGAVKPIIHLAMEEAAAAGASRFVFVISPSRRHNLERYLKPEAELIRALEAKGDAKTLKTLGFLATAKVEVVEQPSAEGLAQAVYLAKDAIGDQPFFMLLPDDVITPAALPKMAEGWRGKCLLAVQELGKREISAYGMVSLKGEANGSRLAIAGIVEKPRVERITSNLAAVGRYVFTPQIFAAIESASANKETQLTEAMDALAKADQLDGFSLSAARLKRFDCGSPKGWLRANAAMAT